MSEELLDTQVTSGGQTIIINQEQKKSNGVGIAGFILSLIGLFIGWIPFLGWLIWLVGLVLSFVGVFKSPKGLAIAGIVISLINIFLILVIFGSALAMSVR